MIAKGEAIQMVAEVEMWSNNATIKLEVYSIDGHLRRTYVEQSCQSADSRLQNLKYDEEVIITIS